MIFRRLTHDDLASTGADRRMSSSTVSHPLFARLYDRIAGRAEQRGQGEHRRRLLAGLSGRVVEVGAGNGLNFPHYPRVVSEVIAVEPEGFLRARAEDAAARAPVPVAVVAGVAESLPSDDASFDAGVASLVLCSVADQARALAELYRVIRPGGELRFYEHVASEHTGAATLQRAADATVWPRVGGGCHLHRHTGRAIEDAGFAIEVCERFPFAPVPFLALPHVRGIARRP